MNDVDTSEYKKMSAFVSVFAAFTTIIIVKCKYSIPNFLVICYLVVYRQNSFQALVNRFKRVSKRQYILVKENNWFDLVGESANPAKSEYQANIDEIRYLKKKFFKVSEIHVKCLGKSSSCSVKHVCNVLSWVRNQQNLPKSLLYLALLDYRDLVSSCLSFCCFIRDLGEGSKHVDGRPDSWSVHGAPKSR